MRDRATLIAALVTARRPGREASPADLKAFERYTDEELRGMVVSLEAVASIVHTQAADPSAAERLANADAGYEAALARLDEWSDHVTSGSHEDAVSPVSAKQPSSMQNAFPDRAVALAGLLTTGGIVTLEDQLRLGSAVESLSGEWRKRLADSMADLLVSDKNGNPVTLVEVKAGRERVDALIRATTVERYLEHAMERTGLGVVRLLGEQLRDNGRSRTRVKAGDHLALLRTAMFEPTFLTDAKPYISAAAATEALSKLYLFGTGFRSNRIVSVGNGGQMIGSFITCEMQMHGARLKHWSGRRRDLADVMAGFEDDDRVLILTDFASHSDELMSLRHELNKVRPEMQTAFAALAGDAATYDQLRSKDLVHFGALTSGRRVELPWRKSGYRRTRTSHFFGDSSLDPLEVARNFFKRVTSGLRAMI